MICNCNSTWSWCYALWSSIAFPAWSWCYALWSSSAIPHDLDATLYDLQLHFHVILMLRSMILHWHFHMNLMLPLMIFNCNSTTSASDSLVGWVWVDNNVIVISTWTWCYALWSSLAFPHELDATLYELSSLAFPHELDATLYDLHWHFHMNLMLRSMIFNVRKSCGCPFWGWSDGRVVIPKVDDLFFDRFWMQKLAPRCEDVVFWSFSHAGNASAGRFTFPYTGNFIIPTNEVILFRGVAQPPIRYKSFKRSIPDLRPFITIWS